MVVIYHNDLDGICSGAIVYWHYQETDAKQKLIEMDYNRKFPFEDIKKNEKVFILDWSFSCLEDWNRLLAITKNVTWIDHHKSAIEQFESLGLRGVRDINFAACELTWNFFNADKDLPLAVALIADYDMWKFAYGDKTRQFQVGVIDDIEPDSRVWLDYFNHDGFTDKAIQVGKLILAFRQRQYKKVISDWGFEIDFEGYHCIACNSHEHRSQLFDSFNGNYDIMMPFVFDGERWKVCLYTKRDDLDLSEIAMKYGGGGHRKAAGFVCDVLPFG